MKFCYYDFNPSPPQGVDQGNLGSFATRFGCLLLAVATALSTGCSDRLYTEYGYSHSWLGRKSINGTAALREMYEARGWETKKLSRLGYHAQQADAIVWFPAIGQTPKASTTEWFNQWLADRPRTLVFVCRGDDHGQRDYWRLAAQHGAPEDRLEYRRRAARSQTEWSPWGLSNSGQSWTNGWFTMESRVKHSESDQFEGRWARKLDASAEVMSTRVVIRPFDPAKDDTLQTGPKTDGDLDAKDQQATFKPLLQTDSGECLAARITSDRWPRSHVIVLSSAQSLINIALIERQNRLLADQLVAETTPVGSVGFLRTDWAGARIVNSDDEQLAAGMELLTTWPLSMATMHAVLMGFVVCLILLPIFGRPRRLPKQSTGDFSAHVTAVADLMHRSGDDAYARERISEYFLRVREDADSRWVIKEPGRRGPQLEKTTNVNTAPNLQDSTIKDAAPDLDTAATLTKQERPH